LGSLVAFLELHVSSRLECHSNAAKERLVKEVSKVQEGERDNETDHGQHEAKRGNSDIGTLRAVPRLAECRVKNLKARH
jgi:hypothetical protein